MEVIQKTQGKDIFKQKEYIYPIDVALTLIGGKWKISILWKLAHRTIRFSELQRQMPATTSKMLTRQLRELERDGLVHRKVYPQVPPKVEYSLTETGGSVLPILNQLSNWGKNLSESQL